MNLNEEDFRWAAATLLSRSFSLDIGEDLVEDESLEDADIMSEMWAAGDTMSVSGGESGLTVALVPWADMLNHSSDAGISLAFITPSA